MDVRNHLKREMVDVRDKQNTLESITNHLKTEMVDVRDKQNTLRSTTNHLKTCPENIGVNSTCKEFRRMGCYCIVEVLVTTISITISSYLIKKCYISTTEKF